MTYANHTKRPAQEKFDICKVEIIDSLSHDPQQFGKLIPSRMMRIFTPTNERHSGVNVFHCGNQITLGM